MKDGLAYMRMLYGGLLARRSVVRVVPACEVQATVERPVFVLGLYRSGTTLLRYVLDSHSRLACPPESDFVHILDRLSQGHAVGGLGAMGFDRQHVTDRARLFAEYFFQNYARSQGKARWVDKSPLYVNHLEALQRLYGDAQFLVLHRHPLDQVHSLTRGGAIQPDVITDATPSLANCDIRLRAAEYWRDRTVALASVASTGSFDCMTIKYEDLCRSPEDTLRPVFNWLGEAWEDGVLRFNEQDHDLGKEAARTRTTTGFEIRTGGFERWPKSLQMECWSVVSDVARTLNYSPPDVE